MTRAYFRGEVQHQQQYKYIEKKKVQNKLRLASCAKGSRARTAVRICAVIYGYGGDFASALKEAHIYTPALRISRSTRARNSIARACDFLDLKYFFIFDKKITKKMSLYISVAFRLRKDISLCAHDLDAGNYVVLFVIPLSKSNFFVLQLGP